MIPACLRSLLLSAFFIAGAPLSSQPAPPVDTVPVGFLKIKVPPPAAFVRCDGIDAEWDRSMRAFFPAMNRLLATYGTPEDQAALKAGKAPDYSRNCNIQVTRSLENEEIGERTFIGLRDEMKSELVKMKSDIERQLQQVLSEGSGKLNKEYGTDAALSISDTVFLGIFEESGSALGFTMAMNAKVKSAGGGEEKSRVVAAAMMSPVNGRMVNFYATMPYTSEADRTAAEKIVTGWREAVVAANPRVAGPEAPGGWFSGTLRIAIIAAVIGGVIGALVAGLWKAFAKKKS